MPLPEMIQPDITNYNQTVPTSYPSQSYSTQIYTEASEAIKSITGGTTLPSLSSAQTAASDIVSKLPINKEKLPLYIAMGILGWIVIRNKIAFAALAGLGYYYYKKTSTKA